VVERYPQEDARRRVQCEQRHLRTYERTSWSVKKF
jgi:hypothetical protein